MRVFHVINASIHRVQVCNTGLAAILYW